MRSDPKIIVTCDNCESYEEELGLTALARGYDERHVDDNLKTLGWKLIDGKDICPECLDEDKDMDV